MTEEKKKKVSVNVTYFTTHSTIFLLLYKLPHISDKLETLSFILPLRKSEFFPNLLMKVLFQTTQMLFEACGNIAVFENKVFQQIMKQNLPSG